MFVFTLVLRICELVKTAVRIATESENDFQGVLEVESATVWKKPFNQRRKKAVVVLYMTPAYGKGDVIFCTFE